uniref:ABC transporter ATP-binding protein n=1 Tax=uncultured bacterium BAC-AB1442/1414/561 TaxID=1562172 RepID=A0A0C4S569_9BACT|nr:ABC transporter ATP-binding protein [uncultured bacterium BAC-AB1442/1414/561]
MTDLMIEATGLGRRFAEVTALDDVDLRVRRGTVMGLLGHNGAGKTTLINILATLLPPTSGTARVAGFDVADTPKEVRRRIGLTGQFAAVDEQLSGLDNLVLIARLLGAGRAQARARATELIELFELQDAAKRAAGTYSGGMRRRLDIAASIVGHPEVIFLDEPTTGLDPVSRNGVWSLVEALTHHGASVLLTTQYLEEADRLVDEITVLSSGRVIAAGTPAELKSRVGRLTAHITLSDEAEIPSTLRALEGSRLQPQYDEARSEVNVALEGAGGLAPIVRALDDAAIAVKGLTLTEPTLDDVYLSLLGRNALPSAA